MVEPDPALVGAEDVVVLDPVSREEANGAVVHPHREVHDDLVLRLAEDRADVGVELDRVRGAMELRRRHLVEVQMLVDGRGGRGSAVMLR